MGQTTSCSLYMFYYILVYLTYIKTYIITHCTHVYIIFLKQTNKIACALSLKMSTGLFPIHLSRLNV